MNFVYLSPHFPPNYQSFCANLHRLGVKVLGVADELYDNLSPRLKDALTEYYRVADLHSYDALLRALGYFTHAYGKLDRIESHNEYWLETEARLRTDFNIRGIKNDSIANIKRKSKMKEVFRGVGLDVARGRVAHTLEEAMELVAEIGFPIVAKPDIGVGAASTYKLKDAQELAAFYSVKPATEFILEEFVDGSICSFDGLLDQNGELVFYTAHLYSQGVMETVQDDDHIYYYSLRQVPADLEEAGRSILKAFGVSERFFHIEFFRKRDSNQLIPLEVNMRPPGGLTTDMFNFANDIDIYREWANVVVANRFEAQYSRPFHCAYVGRKARLPYLHSHDEIVAHCASLLVHHEPIAGVFAPAIGNYGYLLRAADLEPILAGVHYIQELRPT